MRFKNMIHILFDAQGIVRLAARQRTVPAILLCLALAACQANGPLGVVGRGSGFAGMVAADEPRAVAIGRDILSAGGSPADAMVAMSFVLAVTLPSDAGLGGGGACLVYDHGAARTEALDFTAPVPALARGMFALHAKYGRLRWETVLAPAEAIARTGDNVSRALARSLAEAPAGLWEDREAKRIFAAPDGHPLGEGERLVQPDLGGVLSRLRSRGVGDIYSGTGAKDLAAAAHRAGAAFTAEQMQSFLPRWQEPLKLSLGDDTVLFVPSLVGTPEAGLWREVSGKNRTLADLYGGSKAGGRPSGTGVVVMDGDGSAVACGFGLNSRFGAGKVIPDTGILLAAGDNGAQPGPILAVNTNSNEFRFAVVGSGGAAGTAAVLQVGLLHAVDGRSIGEASAAPRPVEGALVNALACGSGAPNQERCAVANDPRGAGLGVMLVQ